MATNPRQPRKLETHGRFWFTLEGENFLGRGRVELLQRIADTGSISQAARAMKMSYKAAWDAVDAINRAWGSPLVTSHPGGSSLTPDADTLIAAYREAEHRHDLFMAELPAALQLPRNPPG